MMHLPVVVVPLSRRPADESFLVYDRGAKLCTVLLSHFVLTGHLLSYVHLNKQITFPCMSTNRVFLFCLCHQTSSV